MTVFALLASLGVTVLESWIAMLIIGAIHSNVPQVPPFSFMASFWLVLLFNVLVGTAEAKK